MYSDTDGISDASLFYGKCRSSFDVFRAVQEVMELQELIWDTHLWRSNVNRLHKDK